MLMWVYLHPSSHCKVPFVWSALKPGCLFLKPTSCTGLGGLGLLSDIIQYLFILSAFHPTPKKNSQLALTLKSSLPWSYFRLREALKSAAEDALQKQNCVSDDVIREWRKSRATVIFSGLDFCECVRVWSQACDNEPCPCHHTLSSLRGGALQCRSCKQSERFNYPLHFYSYLLYMLRCFSQKHALEYS